MGVLVAELVQVGVPGVDRHSGYLIYDGHVFFGDMPDDGAEICGQYEVF